MAFKTLFEFHKASEQDRSFFLQLIKLNLFHQLPKTSLQKQIIAQCGERLNSTYLISDKHTCFGTLQMNETDTLCNISQLCIHPAHCHKGKKQAVLLQMLNTMGEKSIRLQVYKHNAKLQNYYSLGFEKVGEGELEHFLERRHFS